VSFDISRTSFDPWKNYSGVVMEQGRVQTDADWNEWLSELSRRIQAGTLDTMGHAVYPATTPYAFQIAASISGGTGGKGGTNTINIGVGRMYVDGLLVENHGERKTAVWDPALDELSNSPQPPPSPLQPLGSSNSIRFDDQPYNPGATVPQKNGQYLAYLDVWRRPITYIEDPSLVDVAIGLDTTGRMQTAWRVGLLPLPTSDPWTCHTPESAIPWPVTSGYLSNNTVTSGPSGPCCLTTGTGYTGAENQFYRVEIHQAGTSGGANATFKWSRENASVQTGVTGIASGSSSLGDPASVLTVLSLGRDQVLGFSAGNWIEITNQTLDDKCLPGELYKIDTVNVSDMTITLTTPLSSNFPASSLQANRYTRIIRWDQSGKIYKSDNSLHYNLDAASGSTITGSVTSGTSFIAGEQVIQNNSLASATLVGTVATSGPMYVGPITGTADATHIWVGQTSHAKFTPNAGPITALDGANGIPVPTDGSQLILENGITVQFGLSVATGVYLAMNYWNFSARTADGKINRLDKAPPRGIYHHYTKLSIVNFGTSTATATDCRTEWPPSPAGERPCCCTYTVGDNVESFGQYSSIQQAINSLLTTGGEVCILPGRYYEYVVIQNLNDVVIHGCGAQTRLASPSMQLGASQGGPPTNTIAQSGLPAIVTVVGSQHIELSSFAIEAADGEAGILLDSASTQESSDVIPKKADEISKKAIDRFASPGVTAEKSGNIAGKTGVVSEDVGIATLWTGGVYIQATFSYADTDITIKDLVITASTLPAIVATSVYLLKISNNRIAMEDVSSLWASVYVCGTEIHIDHNWIGLQDASNADEWIPASVVSDVNSGFNPTSAPTTPLANGGIQIAGTSQDVFVVENEIEGGAFNAITLGSFILIPQGETASNGELTGLFVTPPSGFASSATLVLPSVDSQQNQVAAGGALQNIQIARNRIRNIGLCGIGPVGFFIPQSPPEIISIENLTITGNTIASTLQDLIADPANGYGAICLPDVQNLILRDNTITDFGNTPGAYVCGIFIFSGEEVEISRNQVRETRDGGSTTFPAPSVTGGYQAGIAVEIVTPPLDAVAAAGEVPIYQPGLPALRVEQNVVRLPLGPAIFVFGYGPFSIVNNHLSSGGTVAAGTSLEFGILTVIVLNDGVAIDAASLYPTGQAPPSSPSSGAVLFANNICQLETRKSGITGGNSSVYISTADHLIFANNHCWVDGPDGSPNGTYSSVLDVSLFAASVQACGNRLQEAPGSVSYSGFIQAVWNITTLNISSYCLTVEGSNTLGANAYNMVFDAANCD
jgi:hypothetical protein